VGGGVDVRGGADAHRTHGRQDHRGEQHHRRIQAQHRRGDGRRDEHPAEQPNRVTPAPPGEHRAQPREHAVGVGKMRDQQDRGEEEDRRPELTECLAGLGGCDESQHQREDRGGDGGQRLRKTARPGDRERQHAEQQAQTGGGGQDGIHRQATLRDAE